VGSLDFRTALQLIRDFTVFN